MPTVTSAAPMATPDTDPRPPTITAVKNTNVSG
jgi:hypothetical protein